MQYNMKKTLNHSKLLSPLQKETKWFIAARTVFHFGDREKVQGDSKQEDRLDDSHEVS